LRTLENLAMNPSFWQGKRVFLTGHTGFKGSWLSLWLQRLGAEVTGYALSPPTNPSLFKLADVGARMVSVIADIRDLPRLQQTLDASQAEIVIHMAAQSLVRHSYSSPVETYATNVMGTVHVLEAVRQVGGVRAVVNVTSDKCYENREWVWGYRENEPMGGHDPYSSSKGCSELVTSAYRKAFFNQTMYDSHGVALASARAGNVIGGGDWAVDRLIPDILRAIEAGKPAIIRNPHAIRPWQHVLEPLSGYLQLAEKLSSEEGAVFAEGWNFGPRGDDARPVQWLVEHLTGAWGGSANWQLDDRRQPHEAHYLKLDCTKANSRLGWHPRWQLTEALARVVTWHQALRAGANMQSLTLAQIEEYEQCGN
jgi:CDP-glucose 4,6-dehydratase